MAADTCTDVPAFRRVLGVVEQEVTEAARISRDIAELAFRVAALRAQLKSAKEGDLGAVKRMSS